MAARVTVTAHNGTVYTDPGLIRIPRNKNTEAFYQLLESYVPEGEKEPSHQSNHKN